MSEPRSVLAPEEERAFVRELARIALDQFAPEELPIFDETADEYFTDPEAVLTADRREEVVGFGLDLALLTPYVLAVATPVVRYLARIATDVLKEQAEPHVRSCLRRLLRRGAGSEGEGVGHDAPQPVLTPEQARRLREIAVDRARSLGLSSEQATLLADAVAGAMVIGS